MGAHRVDALLAELTARYDLQAGFVRKVRPMVTRMLADDVPADRKAWLLEVLAQTCQNDQLIRRRFAAVESALKQLFGTMTEMRETLKKLGPAPNT